MRFLCVKEPATANIFGQEYRLGPLDPQRENVEDILVTDNFSARELFARHKDVLRVIDFETASTERFPKVITDIQGVTRPGRVLVIRNGGIGDHIMFLPVLKILKAALPNESKLWLATQKEKHALFSNNPNIDKLLPLPVTLNVVLCADFLLDMSADDSSRSFERMNLTDYLLAIADLDDQQAIHKAPKMFWSREDSSEIRSRFFAIRKAYSPRPVILLNWKASNRLRDLPADRLLFLTRECAEVAFVVAQPQDLSNETERVISKCKGRVTNVSDCMRNLESYIAAISESDAVVSTDTSTGHLAEALGKPSLIFFGPIDDDLRIRYYRKAYPLRAGYRGRTCVSPCGRSTAKRRCPEARVMETAFAPCLMSIGEERIRSAFRGFIGKEFGVVV